MAILPLKPLSPDVTENYFGLGIADAVITRLSASNDIKVRPTSAVRRFVRDDVDALGAGAQLGVDAVLEGTWQREGDRVRLTMNLLRVETGDSLWTNRFDLPVASVLTIQDRVSEELGASLRVAIGAGPGSTAQAGTQNAEAYDLFLKAKFYLGDRGYEPDSRANSDLAIQLLRRVIALDPRYADAHAMLGFALAHTASFIEDNPELIAQAKAETAMADALSPGLAQSHLNRALILWSWSEGWQIVESIREYRRALALDPAWSDPELVAGDAHLGFIEEWRTARERLLAKDPTNRTLQRTAVHEAFLLNLPEEGLALQKKWFNTGPDERYYLLTGRVAEAARIIEADLESSPKNYFVLVNLAQLRALQGRHGEARAVARQVEQMLPRNRHRHHLTYSLARAAALGGDAAETERLLKETIDWGFPCYPLFSTDAALNSVRKSPGVARVLAQLKRDWDGYRQALAE